MVRWQTSINWTYKELLQIKEKEMYIPKNWTKNRGRELPEAKVQTVNKQMEKHFSQ